MRGSHKQTSQDRGDGLGLFEGPEGGLYDWVGVLLGTVGAKNLAPDTLLTSYRTGSSQRLLGGLVGSSPGPPLTRSQPGFPDSGSAEVVIVLHSC